MTTSRFLKLLGRPATSFHPPSGDEMPIPVGEASIGGNWRAWFLVPPTLADWHVIPLNQPFAVLDFYK